MRGRPAFRPIEPRDAAALRALFERNSDPETTRYFHPFPLTGETARSLATYDGLDRYFVAELDDGLVALSMLRGWDDGFVVPSFGLLVDREWRGRGIGSSLTTFTLDQARDLGAARVRLSVYESHEPALRLYRRLGFVEQSRAELDTPFGADRKLVMSADLQNG